MPIQRRTKDISLIKRSGLFDPTLYCRNLSPLSIDAEDSLDHFYEVGGFEGRRASSYFDTRRFIRLFPETISSRVNPIIYFLKMRQTVPRICHFESELFDNYDLYERLERSGCFDRDWYLSVNADVFASGVDPIDHYIQYGHHEGRSAHEDPQKNRNSKLIARKNETIKIHSMWDVEYLCLDRAGFFDRAWYLATNADVLNSGIDPLLHYVEYGFNEGRAANPDPKKNIAATEILGAKHFFDGSSEFAPPFHTGTFAYDEWLAEQTPTAELLGLQRRLTQKLSQQPLFSLIIPVYKVDPQVVRDLLQSISDQSYSNWEACITLAYHNDTELAAVLEEASRRDQRFRLRYLEVNGGISKNSNAALEYARGEYVILLDHDDLLAPHALYEYARVIAAEPDVTLIYSDKDMISEDGKSHFNPLFKPEWSPDILINANYLTHLNAIKTSRLRAIGGWDSKTDGAQDWDLFFRTIGIDGIVKHVPKVLYHWRLVATSVAAGGLAVKPYAAAAQLEAVRRGLVQLGWSGAEPRFADDQLIQVDWQDGLEGETLLISLGVTGPISWHSITGALEYCHVSSGPDCVERINAVISASHASVVVIIPDILQPITDHWLREMTAPLTNPAIGCTTGKLLNHVEKIEDAGWVVADGVFRPIFRGYGRAGYSDIGFAKWYRNIAGVSFATLAFRREVWIAAGMLPASERPDLAFSSRVEELGYRLLYNPFCESWANIPVSIEQYLFAKDCNFTHQRYHTRYFNPNLVIRNDNQICLRTSAAGTIEHKYSAEAQYIVNRFDSTHNSHANYGTRNKKIRATKIISKSKHKFKRMPQSMLFVLPHFAYPFYGGVMTILRFCDYILRTTDVTVSLAIVGATDSGAVKRVVHDAFPQVADKCRVICVQDGASLDDLNVGTVDVGFCSLWTTAYYLRDMTKCRSKFYFMQDYEPLFYPAGLTSKMAEATYGFGFHAIANTPTLADLYQQHGGRAFAFRPAVDRRMFYPADKRADSASPVVIFSYMRPGSPRNCFELLSAGFQSLKQRYGNKISIFTAGAPWCLREYNLEGVVNQLGLLSYEETPTFYRAADIGVVAMATPHPSYIPYELMACGTAVASTRNAGTSWFFEDGVNCRLFNYNKNDLVETLSALIDDKKLRARVSDAGERFVREHYADWDDVCGTIWTEVSRVFRGE